MSYEPDDLGSTILGIFVFVFYLRGRLICFVFFLLCLDEPADDLGIPNFDPSYPNDVSSVKMTIKDRTFRLLWLWFKC